MDLSESIASKSDQMDYQDFLGGDKLVTVTEVRKGPSAEQPVEVVVAEFDRPWRPAKSVRRVLVAAWGPDSTKYIGKQVLLFGDETVRWAGKPVGGIRIKAMSGLDKPLTVMLTETRGKRAPFTVQPLPDASAPASYAPSQDWLALMADATTPDEKNSVWQQATEDGADQTYLAKLRQAGS